MNGINYCKKFNAENIIIHDVVRPFFSINLLQNILESLKKNDCVIPFINVYDSIRFYKKKYYKNISRENLKLIQTPQGFKFKIIYDAHRNVKKNDFTDDSMLAFENGNDISLIPGEILNFKITEKKI